MAIAQTEARYELDYRLLFHQVVRLAVSAFQYWTYATTDKDDPVAATMMVSTAFITECIHTVNDGFTYRAIVKREAEGMLPDQNLLGISKSIYKYILAATSVVHLRCTANPMQKMEGSFPRLGFMTALGIPCTRKTHRAR